MDRLFAWRGLLVVLPASLLLAGVGAGESAPVEAGLLLLVGLLFRLTAIRVIGGAARTCDPSAPPLREHRGVYRFRHPLYLANILIAMAFVVLLGVGGPPGLSGIILIVGGYGALAIREERQLRTVPAAPRRPDLSWATALVIERSTWIPASLLYAFILVARP